MIVQKYAAALTSIVIVVLSALLAVPSGQLNWTSGLQLASIGLAAVLTYLSPLLNIAWAGILKTGVAILAAMFSAALPIVATLQHGTPFQPIYIAMIVLAAANALGVEVGVNLRTDSDKLIAPAQAGLATVAAAAAIAASTSAIPVVNSTVNEPETPIDTLLGEQENPFVAEDAVVPVETAVNPANQE